MTFVYVVMNNVGENAMSALQAILCVDDATVKRMQDEVVVICRIKRL